MDDWQAMPARSAPVFGDAERSGCHGSEGLSRNPLPFTCCQRLHHDHSAAGESGTLAYVCMSPTHAKAVARILAEALAEYERTFGVLPCCTGPVMEGAKGGGQ